MLFVATCVDEPHSVDKRKQIRPAHLAYLNGLGPRVKTASVPPGVRSSDAGQLDDHL